MAGNADGVLVSFRRGAAKAQLAAEGDPQYQPLYQAMQSALAGFIAITPEELASGETA